MQILIIGIWIPNNEINQDETIYQYDIDTQQQIITSKVRLTNNNYVAIGFFQIIGGFVKKEDVPIATNTQLEQDKQTQNTANPQTQISSAAEN